MDGVLAHPGTRRMRSHAMRDHETLEIYSPLAHRLGIHHIKTELEELGFDPFMDAFWHRISL